MKRAPEQHAKQCAYCKSNQHQVYDCPHTADPCCFKCNSPDHKEKDCTHEAHTNLKHSSAERNLSTRRQQSAAPNDSYEHQCLHQDWPPLAPRRQGRPSYEPNPWFRGLGASTRPYVPPPRMHQLNTEIDLPYARQLTRQV